MALLLATLAVGAIVYGGRWIERFADVAGTAKSPERASFLFECEDGSIVTISYDNENDTASLITPDGTFELTRLISASGARYGAEEIEFWSKGSRANYTRGELTTQCTEAEERPSR